MSAIGQSAGYPVLKFTNPGDAHWGTIIDVRDIQARDFKTKQAQFYSDGNPVLTTVITIQKSDDNFYRLFVKAGSMRTGCAQAVRDAGASDVEPGGLIKVIYLGMEPAKNGGERKAYKAMYKKPDPNWRPPVQSAPVAEPLPEPPDAEEDFYDPYSDEPPF